MASPTTLPFPPQLHSIANVPHPSASGQTFTTLNPTTNTPLALIHSAGPPEISAALAAATAAFPAWAALPPVERSRILLKAVAILRERNDEIARVETLDTGKALCETATVDVATGADVLEYFAGVGMGLGEGKTVRLRTDAWVYTKREPLGVCVGIGAWNYPIQIALWKCAPALAAGNTFVFKPSEVTPLTANILAEVFTAAGLPPGVFNVVHGPGAVGAALTRDPRVAKVSFTGQPSTGILVNQSAAAGLKHVTLELGGKSPLIIMADADLDAAVDAAITANFYSSGQVCTNGTRVFVHADIHDAFVEELKTRMAATIRVGDPLAADTNFGPLVSAAQYAKVRSYIAHGLTVDGATLLTGGLARPAGATAHGYYVAPTVFTHCSDGMKIVRDEIFGPVACVLRFGSVAEVVRRANDTALGLAAGVFTRDLDTAHRVVGGVRAGICWINTWGESPAQMPVGGWGFSGLGVENGKEALRQFTRGKSVLVEHGGVAPAFAKL
ncbi:betaine aldehyde dehydrogenase [Geopyxis carbonaria]|nr:betaine aldehyde dehydrogenase [Geopyxis carbonaria]